MRFHTVISPSYDSCDFTACHFKLISRFGTYDTSYDIHMTIHEIIQKSYSFAEKSTHVNHAEIIEHPARTILLLSTAVYHCNQVQPAQVPYVRLNLHV